MRLMMRPSEEEVFVPDVSVAVSYKLSIVSQLCDRKTFGNVVFFIQITVFW